MLIGSPSSSPATSSSCGRAAPRAAFLRFRAKWCGAAGLTIVPSVLVRWLRAVIRNSRRAGSPIRGAVRTSANAIAVGYYDERQAEVAGHASASRNNCRSTRFDPGRFRIRGRSKGRPRGARRTLGLRIQPGRSRAPSSRSNRRHWRDSDRGSADRLAARIASGSSDVTAHDPVDGGDLVRRRRAAP